MDFGNTKTVGGINIYLTEVEQIKNIWTGFRKPSNNFTNRRFRDNMAEMLDQARDFIF
jgi:hypothetical protein